MVEHWIHTRWNPCSNPGYGRDLFHFLSDTQIADVIKYVVLARAEVTDEPESGFEGVTVLPIELLIVVLGMSDLYSSLSGS